MRDRHLVAEVDPPERRAERKRQKRDEREPWIELDADSACADDDDRLAEGDDDHEPMPLDEVRRRDDEALGRGEPRCDPQHHGSQGPEDPLRVTTESTAHEHDARSAHVVGHEPKDRGHLRDRRALAYMPAWMSTTTRYARPNASPSPSNAVGIASATTRKPPMPPIKRSR